MAAAHHGSNSSLVECCHVMGAAASLEWLRSHEGTAEQQSTPNLIDKRIMAQDEASAESGCENLLGGKEREREKKKRLRRLCFETNSSRDHSFISAPAQVLNH